MMSAHYVEENVPFYLWKTCNLDEGIRQVFTVGRIRLLLLMGETSSDSSCQVHKVVVFALNFLWLDALRLSVTQL